MRAAPTLLICCVVAFGQPLFEDLLPSLRLERVDAYGISVPIPKSWRYGADRLGTMAYNNGLPDSARATFAVELGRFRAVRHEYHVARGDARIRHSGAKPDAWVRHRRYPWHRWQRHHRYTGERRSGWR